MFKPSLWTTLSANCAPYSSAPPGTPGWSNMFSGNLCISSTCWLLGQVASIQSVNFWENAAKIVIPLHFKIVQILSFKIKSKLWWKISRDWQISSYRGLSQPFPNLPCEDDLGKELGGNGFKLGCGSKTKNNILCTHHNPIVTCKLKMLANGVFAWEKTSEAKKRC